MNPYVRIEKRKWDGALSSVDPNARIVHGPPASLTWAVPAGAERIRPSRTVSPRLSHDELWTTVADEWWVLCARSNESGALSLTVHAAVPVEVTAPDVIVWIDLDLDLELEGDNVVLRDETEFHRHAAAMAYPREIVRGAWAGICRLAPRYTMREWPFDGWVERCAMEIRLGVCPRPPSQPFLESPASLILGTQELVPSHRPLHQDLPDRIARER